MSKYQLIPIIGRLNRLKELLEKYDLNPEEKLWIETYIKKLEEDKKLLQDQE